MRHHTLSDVDSYVSKVDPKLRSQFQKLRLIVKEALPGVSESVKWGVPYYSLDGVGVASIADYSGHVNLYLMQGAELSSDLLEGTGKSMRHITVKTLAEIKETEFMRLLREAGGLAAPGSRRKSRHATKAR
jgi:hypothetical protein